MVDVITKRLLAPGIVAGIGIGVLVASVLLSGRWVAAHQRAFDDARDDLAQAARQYRSASDDRAVYREYAERFRDMRSRGWIGGAPRLTWIEALQATNRQLKLPELHYDIGQRKQVALSGAADNGRLHLYRTPMELKVGAQHEYDLVALLHRLNDRGDGLMALSQCTLKRNGTVRLDARAANVTADCALDWFTLRVDREQD